MAPNILLICTDDLGAGDIGVTGDGDITTPHLDALAASGVAARSWYANSPVCSPSRAALFTGRHPAHAGVRGILGSDRGVGGLPPQSTLPGALADAGYETTLLGKWHLGTSQKSSPGAHGFDAFFGVLSGCVDYYSHIMYWGRSLPIHDLWEGQDEVWHNGEYLTDVLTRKAVEAIELADGPFHLTVSYTAPHYPLHAPARYVERFAHLPEGRRMIAAMIAAVDDGVGEIVDALERTGARDDTLIFFSSDNGPSAEARNWLGGEEIAFAGGSTGGLRGHKGSLYEGGIRVPAIWSWPAGLPAGRMLWAPCQMSDVAPTVLEAAGITPYEGIDGVSRLDLLRGAARPTARQAAGQAAGQTAESTTEPLCWEYEGQRAVRAGDWKLVRDPREKLGDPPREALELYDLAADPAETRDLSVQEPERVAELGAVLAEFESRLEGWRA